MSRAVWILHLPKKAEIKVDSGDQVDQGQVLAETEKEKFRSPTAAKAAEIKDNKIKLKFGTFKVPGKGFGKKNVWGKLVIYDDLIFTDINGSLAKKLIFIPELSNLVLKKGAVVGVAGFVTCEYQEEVEDLEIPILVINLEDKDQLTAYQDKNCLLHAGKDCLLIPNDED